MASGVATAGKNVRFSYENGDASNAVKKQKALSKNAESLDFYGAPGAIRTRGLRIRRQPLFDLESLNTPSIRDLRISDFTNIT
jgi:hypothetical protein